jgi:CPA1 family monovalent cation:H+ antiporter
VAGHLVLAVVVGVSAGLAGGWALSVVRSRLEAPVLDTSLSFVAPFLVFVPAELLHGSGLLAVVVAGLFLGYRAPFVQSAEARVAESLNWRTIEFLLENAVFLLIGLALAGIWQGVGSAGVGVARTVWIALVVVAALVLSRLAWGLTVTALYRWGPSRMRRASWRWGQTIPVTLAGSRGVVTLAAVFLLPPQTPDRAFLQLLAFIVVVATLLIALAVPWSVRALSLEGPDLEQERVELELLLAEAQTAGLEELEAGEEAIDELVAHRLRTNATFLRDALDGATPGSGRRPLQLSYGALREQTLGAERRAVLSARAQGRYQEPAVRAVLGIIDAEETALKVAGRRAA